MTDSRKTIRLNHRDRPINPMDRDCAVEKDGVVYWALSAMPSDIAYWVHDNCVRDDEWISVPPGVSGQTCPWCDKQLSPPDHPPSNALPVTPDDA